MRARDTNMQTVSLPRTRCFHSRGKISRLIRQTIAEVVHCLPLSTSTIALYSLHVCRVVSVSRNAEWCPCPNLCVRCPVQQLLIDDKRGVGGVDIATWGHIPGTTLCNTYMSLNSILTHQRWMNKFVESIFSSTLEPLGWWDERGRLSIKNYEGHLLTNITYHKGGRLKGREAKAMNRGTS